MTNVHRLPTAWRRRALILLAAAVAIWVRLVAAAGALAFKSYPYDLRDLNPGARPYSVSAVLPRVDPGVHDRYGVRMRRAHGVLYDFPRGQATYGLLNLSSYVVTDDAFYLDRALAQAQRLRDTRVVAGEAWYFPNRPSKHRHGKPGEFIAAPYYSALAQGRVLHVLLAPRRGHRPRGVARRRGSRLRQLPARRSALRALRGERGLPGLPLAAGVAVAGHASGRHLQRPQLGRVRRLRVLAPHPGRPGAGGVPRGGDDGAAVRRHLPPAGLAQPLLPGAPRRESVLPQLPRRPAARAVPHDRRRRLRPLRRPVLGGLPEARRLDDDDGGAGALHRGAVRRRRQRRGAAHRHGAARGRARASRAVSGRSPAATCTCGSPPLRGPAGG